jgi:O-6-methylguanine DNA methyltransferase
MVHLAAQTAGHFRTLYRERCNRDAAEGELPGRYVHFVRSLAEGRPQPPVAVDLSFLPDFDREILSLLKRIPRGQVRPYAWLAREAGKPKAVRAVGNAMARNPVPLILPCHRVVPSGGGVGNYAFGSDIKRDLLIREGVAVWELQELARKGVRYIGCRTTGIYCFPTCSDAKRTLPANRLHLAGTEAAVAAGLRPCMHCRP